MPERSIDRRRYLGALAGGVAASVAGCSFANSGSDDGIEGSWPMQGHDAQQSWSNGDATGPEDSLEEAWTADLQREYLTSINLEGIGNGRAIVSLNYSRSSASSEQAINALSDGGELEWRRIKIEGYPPAVLTTDHIVHPGPEKVILGRSMKDGGIEWRSEFEEYPSAPDAVNDGAVVSAFVGGSIVGLDAEDGTERWRFDVDAEHPSVDAIAEDGTIVARTDEELVCQEPEGSDTRWRRSFEQDGGQRLIAAETLFVEDLRAATPVVRAIDLTTGDERWHLRFPTGSKRFLSVDHNRLLVALTGRDRDRSVVAAFDPSSGQRRWENEIQFQDLDPVILTPEYAYALGSQSVISIDLQTGAVVADYETDADRGAANMVVAGDRIYYVDRLGGIVTAIG